MFAKLCTNYNGKTFIYVEWYDVQNPFGSPNRLANGKFGAKSASVIDPKTIYPCIFRVSPNCQMKFLVTKFRGAV